MEFIQSCFNLVALAGAAAHALANPTNAEPGLQNSRAADQLQAHLFITEEGVTLTEQYANSMGQHSSMSRRQLLLDAGQFEVLSPEPPGGAYGAGGAYGEGGYGGERGGYGADAKFVGDLTYYGGAGDQGQCSQTLVPTGYTTVAMNAPQFNDALTKTDTNTDLPKCGTCIHACYNDLGLGQDERCFDAIIDNVCPECAYGDVDLGEEGDGRWPVEWEILPCRDFPGKGILVTTQGSNFFYGKIKAEGGPSALSGMFCTDSQGAEYRGEETPDGFWEFRNSAPLPGAFACGLECRIYFSCCYSIGFITVGPELFGGDGVGC